MIFGSGAAIIVAVGLGTVRLRAGQVQCGQLDDIRTWEYATGQRRIPVSLVTCAPVWQEQRRLVDLALMSSVVLLTGALASWGVTRLVRQACAVSASHRARAAVVSRGDQVRVILAGHPYCGRVGTVVEVLDHTHDLDTVVAVDGVEPNLFAFLYGEITMMESGRARKVHPFGTACSLSLNTL